jgi:hypothetical protein
VGDHLAIATLRPDAKGAVMIRHVVMFRWNDGIDAAHVAATTAAFELLPGKIPQIVSYAFGADLGLVPTNFDYAVTGEFATVEDFQGYRDHPDHQALVQSFIGPYVAERVAVQFIVG